jgi:hypothetical protein
MDVWIISAISIVGMLWALRILSRPRRQRRLQEEMERLREE